MLLAVFEQLPVSRQTLLVFADPTFRKFPRLDLFQSALHFLFYGAINNRRSDRDVTPLGGLRNRKPHSGYSRFIHQVDNQLEFVQALEIGHFWLITCLDERFEAVLDQRGQSATQNRLLTKQICLGFFLERCLEYTGSSGADP